MIKNNQRFQLWLFFNKKGSSRETKPLYDGNYSKPSMKNSTIAMIAKLIFGLFIILPNLPFAIILAVYIAVKTYKHTGYLEMGFINIDELFNDEIKKYIDAVYPSHSKYVVAFIFYLWLVVNVC